MGWLDSVGDFFEGAADTVGDHIKTAATEVYDSLKDNFYANLDAVEGLGCLVTLDGQGFVDHEKNAFNENLASGHDIAPLAEKVLAYTPLCWTVPCIMAADRTYCTLYDIKGERWQDMNFDSAAGLCATTADAFGYSYVGDGIRAGVAVKDGVQAAQNGDYWGMAVDGATAYVQAEGATGDMSQGDVTQYTKDIQVANKFGKAAQGQGDLADAALTAGMTYEAQTGNKDIATDLSYVKAGYDTLDGRPSVNGLATLAGGAAKEAGYQNVADEINTGQKFYNNANMRKGSSADALANIARSNGNGDLASLILAGYAAEAAIDRPITVGPDGSWKYKDKNGNEVELS